MAKIKKGDRVVVVTDEYNTTPSGHPNTGYGKGVTGTVTGFRTNRFHGRQAIVELDDRSGFVDWTLTDIERTD